MTITTNRYYLGGVGEYGFIHQKTPPTQGLESEPVGEGVGGFADVYIGVGGGEVDSESGYSAEAGGGAGGFYDGAVG